MRQRILFIGSIFLGFATSQGGVLAEQIDTSNEEDVLIFSSSRSGQGDLYYVNKTGAPKKLLGSDLPEGTARLDPFRKRIVFHRFIGEQAFLFSGEQKIMRDPNGDAPPVWSPTGESIAYVHPKSQKLMVANIDGQEARQITFGDEVDRYPCWSPDGKQLAFCRRTQDGWDLYRVDVPKAQPPQQALTTESKVPSIERLTNRKVYCGHPNWSVQGNRIAFDTEFNGDVEIAAIELNTRKVERITFRPGNDLVPSWSLDGQRLAFAGEPAGSGNWDVWEITLTKPDQIRRVTTASGYDGAPVYMSRKWLRAIQP